MEINQFIFMLLMALHFAPSNATKLNIELADSRKISFVKQSNDYWAATPKKELAQGAFKLKGHTLYAKEGSKDKLSLSIQDVLGESGDNISWEDVKIIRKGEQAAILFERKTKGIEMILSDDEVKSDDDKVFRIEWETEKKKK